MARSNRNLNFAEITFPPCAILQGDYKYAPFDFLYYTESKVVCPRLTPLQGTFYSFILCRESSSNNIGNKLFQPYQRLSTRYGHYLDILIRKISVDPIGLDGQGATKNYIPKFQVATMSLEVA